MENHFLLTFGTTFGSTRTLRIKHPSTTVSNTLMRGTMNNIISSMAVSNSTSGDINSIRSAARVEVTVTPINLDL